MESMIDRYIRVSKEEYDGLLRDQVKLWILHKAHSAGGPMDLDTAALWVFGGKGAGE